MTTQHITQDQIDAEVSKLDPIFLDAPNGFLLSFASAAIQWDRDQRKAELPVLPEPVELNPASNAVLGFKAEHLQAYGAACAAHARDVALEEAICEVDAFAHNNLDLMTAIEALKKAGK